jgi:TonB-dependent SusC/RagA subfamily outer membrane receptor
MNNVNLYSLIDATGWALLHSVWQIAILGAIIWIVFRFVSKDNAKLRYGIASIGLAFILISFALTLIHYFLNSVKADIGTNNLNPELLLLLVREGSDTSKFFNFEDINFAKYFPVMVNLWFIGVCVLSVHMTVNYIQSLRLRKYLTYPISNKTQKIASNLIERLELKRKIIFKESGYVQTPSLIGYFKPIVLLPVSMLSGIPDNQLEIIIAHELAHIKRHDYLFQFVQGILELLFFYHPVVWWLSSVVNTEREHVCDDIAVKVCGESLTLIKALNNMEAIRKKRFELVLGLSGKKNNLFNRVQRIVRPKSESARKTDKLVFSGLFVLLFTGLVLVSNFAISGNAFSGKQFFSKINVIDQNLNQGTNKTTVPVEKDKKKKRKKKSTKSEKTVDIEEIVPEIEIVPEVETVPEIEIKVPDVIEITPEIETVPEIETIPEIETAPGIEIAPEVETEFEIEVPKDSLGAKEWIEKHVSELIKKQTKELEEASFKIEVAKLEMDFEKMRLELEKALKELNSEQLQKEMKEHQADLKQELEELSSDKLIKQFELERKLQKEELSKQIKEIEINKELSEQEKAEMKKRIKETLERVSSKDFKEQLKANIERTQQSLKEHIKKMESVEYEKQLQIQRESLKNQLEKFNSPEYQKEMQEKFERSKENIQKHLEKINTPEYREQLKKELKKQNDSTHLIIGYPTFNLKHKTTNGVTVVKAKNGQFNRIRIKGSVDKHTPLFIVDGKKITNKEIEELDPNNIKSISVLKDDSAISLYGKEAKNGVVLITSKNIIQKKF